MSREKLKQIFIEEATEIIEKMDIDILNFEESPSDKALLNEIFRGVHTLKGSANAFNFTRLGEFVHHFEDALDFFRSSDMAPTSEHVDIFLEGVTVIKAVMAYEVEEIEVVGRRSLRVEWHLRAFPASCLWGVRHHAGHRCHGRRWQHRRGAPQAARLSRSRRDRQGRTGRFPAWSRC